LTEKKRGGGVSPRGGKKGRGLLILGSITKLNVGGRKKEHSQKEKKRGKSREKGRGGEENHSFSTTNWGANKRGNAIQTEKEGGLND